MFIPSLGGAAEAWRKEISMGVGGKIMSYSMISVLCYLKAELPEIDSALNLQFAISNLWYNSFSSTNN